MIDLKRAFTCSAIFAALACGGSSSSEEAAAGEDAVVTPAEEAAFERLPSRLKALYGPRLRTDLIKLDGGPSELNPTIKCLKNSNEYVSGTLKLFLWPTEMTKLGDVLSVEALDSTNTNTKGLFLFAANPGNDNKFELVLTAKSTSGALRWDSKPRDCYL